MSNKRWKGHVIFPLSILSFNYDINTLIKMMKCYGILNNAIRFNNENEEQLLESYSPRTFPENYYDFVEEDSLTKSILYIAEERNITIRKLKFYDLSYSTTEKYLKKIENVYGKDAKVKIKLNVLYDILKFNSLSEREFRVLCAVYSCLGTSPVRIIYNEQIRYRAYGFKSKSKYDAIRKHRKIEIKHLSNKVLKNTIEKLMQRNFFERVRDGRRYYYSKRYRGKDLVKFVFKKLELSKNKTAEVNSILLKQLKGFCDDLSKNKLYTVAQKEFIKKEIIDTGIIPKKSWFNKNNLKYYKDN